MIKEYHCGETPISNSSKNVTHMAVCFKLFLAKHNVQMIEKFHTETSEAYLFFLPSTCVERGFAQKNVTNRRAGDSQLLIVNMPPWEALLRLPNRVQGRPGV